jgi:hypothetical protein
MNFKNICLTIFEKILIGLLYVSYFLTGFFYGVIIYTIKLALKIGIGILILEYMIRDEASLLHIYFLSLF